MVSGPIEDTSPWRDALKTNYKIKRHHTSFKRWLRGSMAAEQPTKPSRKLARPAPPRRPHASFNCSASIAGRPGWLSVAAMSVRSCFVAVMLPTASSARESTTPPSVSTCAYFVYRWSIWPKIATARMQEPTACTSAQVQLNMMNLTFCISK